MHPEEIESLGNATAGGMADFRFLKMWEVVLLDENFNT